MIIDNPIYDHGFEFPDIASFPEIGELQFEKSGYDASCHVYDMGDSIDRLDYGKFMNSWTSLVNDLMYIFPFMDDPIFKEHKTRIENAVFLYMDSCTNQVKYKSLAAQSVFGEISEKGLTSFTLECADTIKNALNYDIEYMQKLPDNTANPHFYDRFKNYNWQTTPRLMQIIEDELRDKRILEGMSEYNRYFKPVGLQSFALHISRPTDTHHFQTLSDCETVTKLIGLHMDPKYNTMKILTYLNDVDDYNGPFQYVPKSNHWYMRPIGRLFAYGLSTGNYLNTHKHRKIATCLPPNLRKNAICGRFIPDNTPMSDMLLNKLVSIKGGTGTSFAFDPTLTLHRGGLCDSGERINLQMLVRPL